MPQYRRVVDDMFKYIEEGMAEITVGANPVFFMDLNDGVGNLRRSARTNRA